jgi:hypothetical protein
MRLRVLRLTSMANMAAEDAAKLMVLWGKHDPSFDISEPERYRQGQPNAGI